MRCSVYCELEMGFTKSSEKTLKFVILFSKTLFIFIMSAVCPVLVPLPGVTVGGSSALVCICAHWSSLRDVITWLLSSGSWKNPPLGSISTCPCQPGNDTDTWRSSLKNMKDSWPGRIAAPPQLNQQLVRVVNNAWSSVLGYDCLMNTFPFIWTKIHTVSLFLNSIRDFFVSLGLLG